MGNSPREGGHPSYNLGMDWDCGVAVGGVQKKNSHENLDISNSHSFVDNITLKCNEMVELVRMIR